MPYWRPVPQILMALTSRKFAIKPQPLGEIGNNIIGKVLASLVQPAAGLGAGTCLERSGILRLSRKAVDDVASDKPEGR